MSFMSSHNGLDCSVMLSHYLFSFLHASVHSGSGHPLGCFPEDRDVNWQIDQQLYYILYCIILYFILYYTIGLQHSKLIQDELFQVVI